MDTDGPGLVSVAQNYTNVIFGLSRNGLDQAVAAHTLWKRFAVSAILYATEAIVLSNRVLEKLDRIFLLFVYIFLHMFASLHKLAKRLVQIG